MAHGYITRRGGSSGGLNYSIRASASAPTGTGKTNEIVIVTTTAIGDTQINCATAPTTRSDGTALQNGDVYISALISTSNPFNALKKNALYGLVGQCKQRISGAWSDMDAYIYQGGLWAHFSTSIPPVGTPLADFTWAQINEVCASGLADTYWSVGDEKAVTLSTSESVTLQIIGFGHDDLYNSTGKASITFCFKDCLNTKMQMNSTNTNSGGYSGSELYQTINGSIYDSLPLELKQVMKTVNKNTTGGSGYATVVTTQEKLFLLSEIEVLGRRDNSIAGEGELYAYFTTSTARTKRVSGVNSIWRLRSPRAAALSFCEINASGGSTYYNSTDLLGISLALCV